jgi:hypothetical protein
LPGPGRYIENYFVNVDGVLVHVDRVIAACAKEYRDRTRASLLPLELQIGVLS